jgi:hypothetical protein
LDPNLAKHPDGGVPLSPADKQALVAFLKTLTDEAAYASWKAPFGAPPGKQSPSPLIAPQ